MIYERQGTMLETDRLLLRPMRAEDRDDLLRTFTDPRVMASFGGELFDQAQMGRWLQRNLDHQAQYGYGLFALIHKAQGELIGDCGLEHLTFEGQPEVELGYDLRSDYWGQGLATEAATAVRDYALRTLGLPRLISLIRRGNAASQAVAARIGMRLTAEVIRGDTVYLVYALNREERPPAYSDGQNG